MRFVSLFLIAALAACASTKKAPYPDAQEIVDRVAARHSDLVRLTLHAEPEGKDCTQVASTMAERRGKPSDPEDIKAMKTGRQIVLDEGGNVDVTVPILIKSGRPTAIAGVTLTPMAGASRDATVRKARGIAQELAGEIRAAGKPVW
jgi:hypothetical protein